MTAVQNPDKTPVAGDVFTYCTREKIDTWHVVRNHNAAGIVDRVVCKACKSEHKYKSKLLAPKAAAPSRSVIKRSASGALLTPSPSARSSSGSSSASLEDIWFSGIKKWGAKEVNVFDPGRHFVAGEVLQHPVFGKGVVQSRRENKIDVLFPSGVQKTLPSK